jgi:hypothetical protein
LGRSSVKSSSLTSRRLRDMAFLSLLEILARLDKYIQLKPL